MLEMGGRWTLSMLLLHRVCWKLDLRFTVPRVGVLLLILGVATVQKSVSRKAMKITGHSQAIADLHAIFRRWHINSLSFILSIRCNGPLCHMYSRYYYCLSETPTCVFESDKYAKIQLPPT